MFVNKEELANQKEELTDRIDNLEKRIFKKEEGKEVSSLYEMYYLPSYLLPALSPTLEERVNNLQEVLKKQEGLTHLILDHLKLEYVKVTEENGEKKVEEKLRPVSKKKAKERKNRNCDCCDYAE